MENHNDESTGNPTPEARNDLCDPSTESRGSGVHGAGDTSESAEEGALANAVENLGSNGSANHLGELIRQLEHARIEVGDAPILPDDIEVSIDRSKNPATVIIGRRKP